MRLSFLVLLLGLLPAAGTTPENNVQKDVQKRDRPVPAPAAAQGRVEADVKHLLMSQVESWNAGKLEEFMQGYWRSADLTFFSGAAVTKGWEPTLLRYRRRYQAEGREMGKLEFNELHIDALSPRSAVVTGRWQLTLSDGKQPHGLFTLILKKMPQGWRIVHDHTSSE